MQSLSLLLLRFSTGMYLILWGVLKFASKEAAVSISDKYYGGIASVDLVNAALGCFEIIVGLLVILGLFRAFAYKAQAAIYLFGVLAIAPYIIDPFGLYIASAPKLTFFPSTTLFFASLIMLAFKEFDTRSLDAKRQS